MLSDKRKLSKVSKSKSLDNFDSLADRFNTHKKIDEIHPDAAVNIYVGWPFLLEQVKYHCEFLDKKCCRILDFGCGAGEFCKALHIQNHEVVGIDCSESLIKIAKEHSPKEITYLKVDNTADSKEFSLYEKSFNIITAIHSFDWIENLDEVIENLVGTLDDNGIILFSIFPKSHVKDSLVIQSLFEDFDSMDNPTVGVCNFDGVRVPVYVRDVSYYDTLFSKFNMEKFCEYYPSYPAVFLKRFKWDQSMEPEMLILGYRKRAKKY